MISLLPFDKSDYDQLISWVTDEEMLMQFAGPHFSFPLTTEQLELSLAGKNRMAYKILHTADQTIIGHAEIVLQDASTALLSRILIGEMAYRGKGLALPLVNQLLTLAFKQPGIEEISLNVFDWNIPAIKTYEKAGFRINKEKTLIRYVNNKTWTGLNMRLSRKILEGLHKNS
jgi:RimJ/RimL family protein N-acetyltransferase